MMRSKKYLLGVTMAFALALTACSSAGVEPAETGTTAPAGESAMTPDQIEELVDTYTAVPELEATGGAIDLDAIKGKTVFNIPDSSANPFASGVAEEMKRAADVLGLNFINCENQGQVTEWVSCYNQAIQRKVDLITNFGGTDPRQLIPQIEAAQAAGIVVVAPQVYGLTQEPDGPDYSVPSPFEKAGELMATWVAADTEQKSDVLVLTSNEVASVPATVQAMEAQFKKVCPECNVEYVNVPVKDWATRIQGEVQGAINRNPNLNYVLPLFDSMTQFVVPAITSTGKIGQIHVASFNGTPFVLKYMQEDDIVRMIVGESIEYLGFGFMDANARILAGEDMPKVIDTKIPLRMFTKDNVDETGTPPENSRGYGDSVEDHFRTVWGVS